MVLRPSQKFALEVLKRYITILGVNDMLLDVGGGGWRVSKCSGRPIFIFFVKENWAFEIRRPTSRGWKKFRRRWTREVKVLKNLTIFMDVICVSSLKSLTILTESSTLVDT